MLWKILPVRHSNNAIWYVCSKISDAQSWRSLWTILLIPNFRFPLFCSKWHPWYLASQSFLCRTTCNLLIFSEATIHSAVQSNSGKKYTHGKKELHKEADVPVAIHLLYPRCYIQHTTTRIASRRYIVIFLVKHVDRFRHKRIEHFFL